jgi:hypothetical protein
MDKVQKPNDSEHNYCSPPPLFIVVWTAHNYPNFLFRRMRTLRKIGEHGIMATHGLRRAIHVMVQLIGGRSHPEPSMRQIFVFYFACTRHEVDKWSYVSSRPKG